MYSLTICLAETIIIFKFRYEELMSKLKSFYAQGKPEFTVEILDEELLLERQTLSLQYPHHSFKNYEIEYNALYRKTSKLLFDYGIITFHGVLLSMKNEGYLFSAPSGVGKTTHALLWKKAFPGEVRIINGDKPLLKIKKDGLYGYGSPWQGKENLGINACIKIKAICYLMRGQNNIITNSYDEFSSIEWLINQTMLTGRKSYLSQLTKWYKKSLQFISTYELQCNKNIDAAIVAQRIMSKKYENIIGNPIEY